MIPSSHNVQRHQVCAKSIWWIFSQQLSGHLISHMSVEVLDWLRTQASSKPVDLPSHLVHEPRRLEKHLKTTRFIHSRRIISQNFDGPISRKDVKEN